MTSTRRRSQLTAGAMLLAAVVLLAGCGWPQGWPQSRYGPGHTGFNPFETTISPANVSGLGIRWSARVGDGRAFEAPPTIANGVLYVSSGKLYAFDATTGSARWSSQGIGYTESSPVVDNGVVYVSATKDGDGQLYAFDARSGTARWSQNIVEGGASSPTVANGVVYVGGDKLYAFNATTGAQLWSAATDLGPYGSSSPAVANGVVYVGRDKLYAFNATTGAQLWSAGSAGGYGSPAVANGVVYVGGDKLYAFNATTGTQLWSANTGNGYRSPAVANGVVYVGAEQLYALNATTGAQLWSAATGYLYGSPTVANGVVYVGADKLYAYNATTGTRLWSAGSTGGGDYPVVANGVVFVGADKLYAYRLPITTPQLSISPAFPADYVFGNPTSTARTFTITNIGSMPTSLITDSLSGPDAAHFRLTSDACAGTSLAGGASCTVTASFTPTLSGPRTAWLTSAAAAGGTANALLAGTAQPLTLSPSWKDFGDFGGIFAGSTSTAVFTVTNLSVVPVGPIANSITAGSGFTITADACAGTTIAAGTSCTVAVKFAPTSSGNYAGALITRASGYQAEANLSGTGLSQLAVAPSSKDFGQVRAGTTASATFTVTNISPSPAGPITEAIDVFGPNWWSITSDTCAGTTLARNSSCTVVVTFAPTSTGFSLARLRTAAPSGAVTAGLSGAGT